jgi:hypothetical protein
MYYQLKMESHSLQETSSKFPITGKSIEERKSLLYYED